MDKVIVYGLGKHFERHRINIESWYEVVGYCDADEQKKEILSQAEQNKFFSVSKLKEMKYDYILVMPSFSSKIEKEFEIIGIEKRKIKNFVEQDFFGRWWGGKPLLGVSYSEGMEDIIVDSLREKLGIPYEKMKYIELGVMHPVSGNNTYFFYKRGASGILVEANPELISLIRKIRERDIILNNAIFDQEGEINFYIHSSIGLSSVVSGHREGEEEHSIEKIVPIKTIHMNEVFEKLSNNAFECDLLSIDIEGYDLEALKSLDFLSYRPKIIIAELLPGDRYYQKIVNLLLNNGYLLCANTISNGIFIDKKYEEQL